MQGLRTARALVLDDRPSEAMPVVHALSQLGVAALYHSGACDSFKWEKLKGIRILFLDMVLKAFGADENDPVQCAGMVASILSQVVDLSRDPVAVICWTAHKDMAEEFTKAFRAAFPNNRLSKVSVLEKPTAAAFADPTILKGIEEAVLNSLQALEPMSALLTWEQRVHDAATSTSQLLALLVSDYCGGEDGKWDACAFRILATLALAERGSRLRNESNVRALEATFAALNPILEDALEHPIADGALDESAPLCKTLHEQVCAALDHRRRGEAYLPPLVRATLNTRILTSIATQEEGSLPGSLYTLESGSPNRKSASQGWLGEQLLLELRDDTFFWGDTAPTREEFCRDCVPVIMEVSPACDFAQSNTKLHRLVAGFWVKEGPFSLKLRDKTDYMRRVEPLSIVRSQGGAAEIGCLVFNAHFTVALPCATAKALKPFMRLRTEALGAIIFWLAGHHSRPGVLEV